MRHGRGQRARCRDFCALPDDHHACGDGCTTQGCRGCSSQQRLAPLRHPRLAGLRTRLPGAAVLLRGHVYPNAQTAVTRGRCGTCARCGARQRWPARTRCPCATWTLRPGASTCCSAPATTAACASGTCGAPPAPCCPLEAGALLGPAARPRPRPRPMCRVLEAVTSQARAAADRRAAAPAPPEGRACEGADQLYRCAARDRGDTSLLGFELKRMPVCPSTPAFPMGLKGLPGGWHHLTPGRVCGQAGQRGAAARRAGRALALGVERAVLPRARRAAALRLLRCAGQPVARALDGRRRRGSPTVSLPVFIDGAFPGGGRRPR